MVITEETKLRFIAMLAKRHVIVIQVKSHGSNHYRFKFIGADDSGKWDFTPMVADTAGVEYNGEMLNENLSIVAKDAADLIVKVIKNMAEDGLILKREDDHETYEKVRHLLTTFYM